MISPTIHTPKTDLTSGMIGARELAAMKPGAVLINCARGGLVDETALLAALSSGKLLGAGLDVFDDEPLGRDNPFLKLPNVILSPHSAGSTRESGRRMGIETAENILAALDGTLPDDNIFNLDALRAAGHR
ncbi:MAG: NAD(P)-dependent oxidoreductase [Hyphomicrobiaceae bacterium]